MDFPRFDGEDVQGWVYRCEQFFEVEGTPGNLKVRVASIQLTGKALTWHQSFMKGRNGVWPGWDKYKGAMGARFGIQPFDDPLAELMKLKQQGTVEQYQESFDALLNRVELPTSHAVSCFLSGLCDEIQNAVRMFKPQTIRDANIFWKNLLYSQGVLLVVIGVHHYPSKEGSRESAPRPDHTFCTLCNQLAVHTRFLLNL